MASYRTFLAAVGELLLCGAKFFATGNWLLDTNHSHGTHWCNESRGNIFKLLLLVNLIGWPKWTFRAIPKTPDTSSPGDFKSYIKYANQSWLPSKVTMYRDKGSRQSSSCRFSSLLQLDNQHIHSDEWKSRLFVAQF